MRWLPLVIAGTGAGLVVAELAYRFAALPAPMAVHFNGAGLADGWADKSTFAWTMIGGMAALGIPWAAARMAILRAPASLLNLPRRDYWLAPEREAATRAAVAERLDWVMCATLLLVAWMFHLSIRANLNPPARLSGFVGALGVYGVFVLAWIVELMCRFSRPR